MKLVSLFLATMATLAAHLSAPAFAADTVVLVRHAERVESVATMGGGAPTPADPELSPAGLERAESLARSLKRAGITAIFSTDFKRTQQTAAPLATMLGVKVQIYDPKDVAGLVAKLKAASGTALVVGHSNTVPETIKALGIKSDVTIPETEFDNLFIVTGGSAKPTLIRLRYQ